MNQRMPLDGADRNRPDDSMDQFNLDRLAALDASLHGEQRKCDRDIRVVIEIFLMGAK